VEVDQDDVDQLYAAIGGGPPDANLPKGLNRPTLALILRNFHEQVEPASAQELADRSGLSRATVRRYLEYLEGKGLATLELRYGAAGRPEHRYRLVQSN
jgi:two-component system CitB family response regulator